jgi:hypothetical protein
MRRDVFRLILGGCSRGYGSPPSVWTPARDGAGLPHHSPEGNGRTGGVYVALVSGFLPEEVGGRGAGQRSRGRAMVPGHAEGVPLWELSNYSHNSGAFEWRWGRRLSYRQRVVWATFARHVATVLFKWLKGILGFSHRAGKEISGIGIHLARLTIIAVSIIFWTHPPTHLSLILLVILT